MSSEIPGHPVTAASTQDSSHADTQPVKYLGDWLISVGDRATPLPCRTPDDHWQVVEETADWHWMTTSPSDEWRGSPVFQVRTSDWTAWLVGELYGTADPAQTVIDLLENQTHTGGLNGHFLLVARDNRAGELHVWTDRHATLHAYLATDGARTAVGSHMSSVAAATGRVDLDWEGLTSFFGFGFFAADRTHFSGVRILRPATHYRLDRHGRLLAEERYWQWRHEPDALRSYDETVDEFAGLFASVMREMAAGRRIAFPISGGLDSRSTIATIADGALDLNRFWSFSYGYGRDSIETKIAGRIAAARSLPYTQFVIEPYLFDRLNQIMGAVEGFQDVTMARQAAITDAIRHHSDRVIAAHWGDVFLDDMGLTAYLAGSLTHDQLVDKALVKFGKPYGSLLDILCRPRLGESNPELVLRGLISGEMNRLPDIAEPDFFIKALKTEQWSARWTTASIRMYQAGAFPRLPFYDTRISDFFTTVPTEFVAGRRLQIDYLKRYAPDLAAVAWQETGTSLYKVGRRDPLALARRAVNKGRRKLSGRRVIERNWEVQFLNPDGRRGLERRLLQPGLLLHDFISPKRLVDELEAFYDSPWADKRSYPISMMLTFSAWLEGQTGMVRR